jgi:uncharacterized protein YndB with AHSA1/START domain
MSVNQIDAEADPAAVFAVLSDAESYGSWVVGSSQIRDVEGPWPAEGATFHHTQGVGPLGIHDTTSVLECIPGSRLRLEVRARPAVVAEVEFDLRPHDGGTRITMTEVPISGWASRVPRKMVDGAIHLRNAETLRRLRKRAEKLPV